ncbi:unnamed protein product [Arctogadus glacialis]
MDNSGRESFQHCSIDYYGRRCTETLPPGDPARGPERRNGIRFDSAMAAGGVRQAGRGASLETGLGYRHINSSKPDRLRQTENRATRCKVERLQLLMQQKRQRRKARRDGRAPYQWLPHRRAGRSSSSSSVSSEGSVELDMELDSVWKPDVKADMKPEFVMA